MQASSLSYTLLFVGFKKTDAPLKVEGSWRIFIVLCWEELRVCFQ